MWSAYLAYLYEQLAKCQKLQGDIASVINTLGSAINTYEDMSSSLKENYVIEGEETTTNKRVVKNKEAIQKIKSHLAGPTSGKVSARIGWLQSEIAKELARLAAEAAARAAATASTSNGGDK